jgi:hypothetical protein
VLHGGATSFFVIAGCNRPDGESFSYIYKDE